jgi:hypothetical protein
VNCIQEITINKTLPNKIIIIIKIIKLKKKKKFAFENMRVHDQPHGFNHLLNYLFHCNVTLKAAVKSENCMLYLCSNDGLKLVLTLAALRNHAFN